MAKADHLRLDFLHAFGSITSTEIRDSVCLGDHETNSLIYPIGKHIGVRNLQTSDINFIRVTLTQQSEIVARISAIAISRDRNRRFLAVAQQISRDTAPKISVIDLKSGSYFKQVRELGFGEMQSEEFRSLSFSSDSRLIAAVSGPPDFIGVIWDW